MNILKVLQTETFKNSLVTTMGTLINGGLGLLFYIMVGRLLEPEKFGIFAFSIAVLVTLTDVASFGTDSTIIRFVGKYINTDHIRALRFLKFSFEIRLFIWVLIGILGWLSITFITTKVLEKPEYTYPLSLILIGLGGSLLFGFVNASLQAIQKYIHWSFLNISLNFSRLITVGMLYYFTLVSVNNILLVYLALPFAGFVIGLLMLPHFFIVKHEDSISKEFFNYNQWATLFIVLAAISSRVDVFLISKFLSNYDMGIYAAANQLVSIVPQFILALAVVVAPKFANFKENTTAIVYFKKLQIAVSVLCLIGVVLIPIFYYLIPVLFGNAYFASRNIFLILYLAQLIFLFSLPTHQVILYYYAKPQLFVWISAIHLLVMCFGGWYLINILGVIGVAVTVLIGTIFNFIIPGIWVVKKFLK